MDAYPQDLLVGVFPLVFAVNAIHSESDNRVLFDRFLDVVAASLVETTNDAASTQDDSDDDLLGGDFGPPRRSSSLSVGFYAGFGNRNRALPTTSSSAEQQLQQTRPSYAKALTNGQGFFQRARIESVSCKHGFPPSKDPDGSNNFTQALKLIKDTTKLRPILQQHFPPGILPAGWLEKHVHALPSVILAVCTVSANPRDQTAQDALLMDTIQRFWTGLVPKRKCPVHIVGLVQDDVSNAQGDEWVKAVTHLLWEEQQQQGNSDSLVRVTLLRWSDLQSHDVAGMPSTALRSLHKSVRDASMIYYQTQARRTKDKLNHVTTRRRQETPQLLPLVIRYCFKIAIFYEFQYKFEKSLRYMAEGYRHAARYYQYLLARPESTLSMAQPSSVASSVLDTGDSFEVSLSDSKNIEDERFWESAVPAPAADMVHQCRSVAEWLNLKLLQAGFASHTEGGLRAAANQWRRHCRQFCTRRRPLHAAFVTEEWFEWSYIARQRLVMSQLVERHPPKALGDLGNEYDEVLLRCSPWRNYEAAAEALLRVARQVDKAAEAATDIESKNSMRPRYVGGLDSEGLKPALRELSHVNHRAQALDLVMRAISLYERELEKEKRGFYAEDNFSERSSSRAGARMYYLAGGILLGMDRHQEAATHLEKASKFATGWRELELAIRRMLIECYEKDLPSSSQASEESNLAIASMILDSYFNAEMSARDLRRALGHFASISGGKSLKWYHDTVDEEDTTLPFSFAVSFPGVTHATAGEAVQASVLVTSNLDYAVHVTSVILVTLAGELTIPPMDLLSASNASEGSEGGIIIQSKTSIIISTEWELPMDTSIIAVDESGNGGEMEGVAGKGSFAKSARPRSAGITAAGGARLLPEDELSPGNEVSQGWSLVSLGGKPLKCDAMRLVFCPVQAEKAADGAESLTLIELTIEKKKPKTPANIKRTPFEEENYIASAWSRPMHLPLSQGPRTLRVLGPMPELMIKNLTERETNLKALEGTVNRVLLKFTAGPQERCVDLKVRLSCFSVLLLPDGSTKRLVSGDDLAKEADRSVDMKNPIHRTPVLVEPCTKQPNNATPIDYGYELPIGWKLAGTGQMFDGPTIPNLSSGESKCVHLDIFRPGRKDAERRIEPSRDEPTDGSTLCKTDFYVSVCYRQERTPKVKRSNLRRSGRRRLPVLGPGAHARVDMLEQSSGGMLGSDDLDKRNEELASVFEEVSLEFTGSVVWGHPLSATFRLTGPWARASDDKARTGNTDSETAGEREPFVIQAGERVTTCCSLELDGSAEGMKTEIFGVHFEAPDTDQVDWAAASPETTLHRCLPNDPCRVLGSASKLSVAYTTTPSLRGEDSSVSTLGAVLVNWKPSSLPIPSDASLADEARLGAIHSHGPLRLTSPSVIRFPGPDCRVEKAPFEVQLHHPGADPSTGQPFALDYSIRNHTSVRQTLSVKITSVDGHDGLVFGGLTRGAMVLGPLESQALSYTVLATRSGKIRLPLLEITSLRYGTSVIHEPATKEIYVFP